MSGRSPRWIQKISRGTPLGDIEVGTLVKLNENGTPAEFYVACHNYEASLNGNGRTLLVRHDCYDECQFGRNRDVYANGPLDTLLTGPYFNLLDAEIRKKIGITKFHCANGKGSTVVSTLERAIFQLSLTELGKTGAAGIVDGTALPIASTLQVAHRNGTAVGQWTRSVYGFFLAFVYILDATGESKEVSWGTNSGSRPSFTLPASTLVGDDMLIV